MVVVRQEACKELLRNFNALYEESFFNKVLDTAWSDTIGKLTKNIQERLIQKDNCQFLKQERSKTEKKLDEEMFGKLSIESLRDGVDFNCGPKISKA